MCNVSLLIVFRGQDPSVNVVLMEDLAAVVGVVVAGVCMGLSTYTQSHIPDAVGSLLVGGILGSVASFIIYTNVAALVGRYNFIIRFVTYQRQIYTCISQINTTRTAR